MVSQFNRNFAHRPGHASPLRRWLNSAMIAAALSAIAAVSGVLAQRPDAVGTKDHLPVASVAVGGEVSRPLQLDIDTLSKLPRTSVAASAHGVEGHWQGVALIEILRKAGAPVDEALRGRNFALYVRVTAADGYRVVFALAELDPKFRDDKAILADHEDDKPLGADQGPFRIIAPAEKRPGRWVRQVVRIDVLRATD